MSCISLNIQIKNKTPVLSVVRIGGISAKVSLAYKQIDARAFDAIEHPSVRCSLVCSVKELKNYLHVSPEEIQWITPEYGIIYNVYSDLDWIVVTS